MAARGAGVCTHECAYLYVCMYVRDNACITRLHLYTLGNHLGLIFDAEHDAAVNTESNSQSAKYKLRI